MGVPGRVSVFSVMRVGWENPNGLQRWFAREYYVNVDGKLTAEQWQSKSCVNWLESRR